MNSEGLSTYPVWKFDSFTSATERAGCAFTFYPEVMRMNQALHQAVSSELHCQRMLAELAEGTFLVFFGFSMP